jgi:hypothetical protein
MDRISIPMILPVAVTMLVVLIIVAIGSLLIFLAEEISEFVAVAGALAIAGAVLAGCALAARGGTEEHHTAHH